MPVKRQSEFDSEKKSFEVKKPKEKEFLIQSDTSFVVRNIVEEVDNWGDKKYKVFAEVIL